MTSSCYPKTDTPAKPSAVYASYSDYLDREANPRERRGFVYYIGPVGGPVKVGFTSCVEDRLRSLQTGNPANLILWASIEGTPSSEARVHRDLQDDRVRGEWFAVSPRLLRSILNARAFTDQKRKWPEIARLNTEAVA